jgi:hypothetical protein
MPLEKLFNAAIEDQNWSSARQLAGLPVQPQLARTKFVIAWQIDQRVRSG